VDNAGLFEQIAKRGHGTLISEYPLGVDPEPWRFPARNRIISGLSMGVLVIETPVQSGAMITAHQAADQGREVMAIPGPVDTGRSSGCHRLIQEGARLVQTVDDIFEELGVLRLSLGDNGAAKKEPTKRCLQGENLTDTQKRVISLLTLEPKTLDEIAEGANIAARDVSSTLTILELNRLARKIGGQGFVRVL
jgi:DNA processing protein